MASIGLAKFRSQALRLYSFRPSTTRFKVRQVLDILARIGVRSTADLTTATAASFVADRGPNANPNTTIGLLAYLKALCNLAVEEGWLDRAPNWRRVAPKATPATRSKALDPDQVARLLTGLRDGSGDWRGHRLYAMTGTVALTGLRFREAAYLTPADVDCVAGFVRVRPSAGNRLKTSASADTVPLPRQAVEILGPWLERCGADWVFPGVLGRSAWTGGAPGYRPLDHLKAAGRAVGVAPLTWHGLRHTYATSAVRYWGLPLWLVQRCLRHTSQRTTELYLGRDQTPDLVKLVASAGYPFAA